VNECVIATRDRWPALLLGLGGRLEGRLEPCRGGRGEEVGEIHPLRLTPARDIRATERWLGYSRRVRGPEAQEKRTPPLAMGGVRIVSLGGGSGKSGYGGGQLSCAEPDDRSNVFEGVDDFRVELGGGVEADFFEGVFHGEGGLVAAV